MKNNTQAFLAETHNVENQSGALENYNSFAHDRALTQATRGFGTAEKKSLTEFGQLCGSAEYLHLGHLANQHKPQFKSHDRFGHRTDAVEFHPAYHQLMQSAIEHQLHSSPWLNPSDQGHQYRAAKYYLQAQVEAGHGCPITMTFASHPTLNKQANIAEAWQPLIQSSRYDASNKPWYEKSGLTLGMAMTEKQGGSDVRANSTKAYPVGQPGAGELYELVGHKYFVSAPMSDGFLVLAYASGGLSCFLVPRWRPDGSKNPLQIQQLKNKMGNVSNASSEAELRGALGWLIGDEGRGVANILEMVSLTRFDCMIGSSAGQRAAVAQAIHHAERRQVFGAHLVDQPLMSQVLADLALESEASLALTLRMAQALDNASSEHEQQLLRIGTAVGKYWICKRTPGHAYEAMECMGGMGVMEDGPLARLYREAPINAIWEGSGNVQCLDLMRIISKSPQCLDAVWLEVGKTAKVQPLLQQYLTQTRQQFTQAGTDILRHGRYFMERLALCLQASSLLHQQSPNADAFCASRLQQDSQALYGAFARSIDSAAVVRHASPHP
ncbi:acyl-CoA dehydrogenase family protein [Simiduia curdlanivorans]|uniref:Acyl-CoA dehydrogenase family protein n=1 Tax=Simiduia curdlanivorans TaxID=1492769 RepID=A0ABV8VB76_9GAMM|nr:acyl-CoA dehydrogenase family protein [Simiduia curdlanivorans]MDN3639343.1 acyl-CoA dehydrogenase family protein [Simiduia curdlanivorans]